MITTIGNDIYNNLIAEDRWLYLLKGLGVTLKISFFAILIGCVIGILIVLMKMSSFKLLGIRVLDVIANIYVTVIRGTPLVTQVLIIYFVVFASVNIDKTVIAVIAFGLNSGAYVSEIIRAGIQAVDKGQMEAGRSLGFNVSKTMLYIIMPQAVKNIIPTLANEFIVLIKETAIVGYIAIEDLTKVGDIIRSRTYSAFVPLVTVALVYLLVTGLLAKGFSILERRLRISDNR